MTRQFITIDDEGNEYEIIAVSKDSGAILVVGEERGVEFRTSDGRPVVEVIPGCTYEIVGVPNVPVNVKRT